jgi:hypothetical protein
VLRGIRAAVAAVAVLALTAPAADAAPDRLVKGFWGPVRASDGTSEFPVYRRLGVKLYQYAVPWSAVAPTRPANPTDPNDPAYGWSPEIDYAVAEAARNDMRVLLQVAGAPRWANGNRVNQWAPRDPQDFADFVTAVARRYPTVRHWMIWGEPSRTGTFLPLTPQTVGQPLTARMKQGPRRYAELLDASYVALKAESRRNLVIGGNTFSAGDIRPANWVRHMRLPGGKRPRMDLYGHNPFCQRTPDLRNPPSSEEIVDFSDLGRFRKVIDRYLARPRGKRTIRLFLSEWAVPTAGDDHEFYFHTTPEAQVRFIKNGFKVARAVDAYGLGWIHLRDEDPPPGQPRGVRSGLIYANGREKPGFAAFAAG